MGIISDTIYRAFMPKVTEYPTLTDALADLLAQKGGFELPYGEALLGETSAAIRAMTPFKLWETQPYLRTVISFRARNTAQLGLHAFRRISDTDRKRDHDSPLARLLRRPNPWMTAYELIFSLVGDLDLYDTAYWWLIEDTDAPADGQTHQLVRIPPAWVTASKYTDYRVTEYQVQGAKGERFTVPAEQLLVFSGYHPKSARTGSPAIEALREIIQEQLNSTRYRAQIWKNGGRVSSVITRPAGAPRWSDEARKQFREDWYASFTGNGPTAGGTPILGDGMKVEKLDLTAQDQQWAEGTKLALNTVAAAYHVNPTMVGALEQTNYSNMKEFRKMLYGETLGPILAQVEARINTFLLPMLGMPDEYYAEFNVAEKLQGDFEAQTQALQSSVGRPWRTTNEARALQNLPRIEGGDELVVPLNVLIGGQASPRDSVPKAAGKHKGPQARGPQIAIYGSAGAKSAGRADDYEDRYKATLRKFFRRQEQAVRRLLKDPSWWDGDRWDKELTADLFKLGLDVSTTTAKRMLEQAGISPEEYDADRTEAWILAVSERNAKNINDTTRAQIESALTDDEDPEGALDSVFDGINDEEGGRLGTMVLGMVTTMSAFGVMEAGQQSGATSKTWVTGPNPRPEHAAMDGETVPMSEDFSNGMPWPGSPSGDADDLAGCNCSLDINW